MVDRVNGPAREECPEKPEHHGAGTAYVTPRVEFVGSDRPHSTGGYRVSRRERRPNGGRSRHTIFQARTNFTASARAQPTPLDVTFTYPLSPAAKEYVPSDTHPLAPLVPSTCLVAVPPLWPTS